MDSELRELNSQRSESFKFKVFEEINAKYFALKMESEKREAIL
jgi:hypothetical protein